MYAKPFLRFTLYRSSACHTYADNPVMGIGGAYLDPKALEYYRVEPHYIHAILWADVLRFKYFYSELASEAVAVFVDTCAWSD